MVLALAGAAAKAAAGAARARHEARPRRAHRARHGLRDRRPRHGRGARRAAAPRLPRPPSRAAKQRIAAGGAAAARGRALFEDEGCDRCHSIAAIGAEGKLGPRLDTIDDDADDIAEAIVEPREDIVDGFPEKLMPDDYGERLSDAEVADLAAFVAAASGGGRGRATRRRGLATGAVAVAARAPGAGAAAATTDAAGAADTASKRARRILRTRSIPARVTRSDDVRARTALGVARIDHHGRSP